MSDDFLWLKPRYLYRISIAISRAETQSERYELYKLFLQGVFQWGMKSAVVVALLLGVIFFDDSSKLMLANLSDHFVFFR